MDRNDQRKWEGREKWWDWLEVSNMGQDILLYIRHDLKGGKGKVSVANLSVCYMLSVELRRHLIHESLSEFFSKPSWRSHLYSNSRGKNTGIRTG